ncbi:MAG: hypothetical protein KME04_05720 [Pleurocapsa minor GSE-CHR-MK-17-07R]|jgi:hypothetical protein|nr:hypothetical protein [Pleurocapsa minor GSE-CHR-MK 17-07R]
MAAINSASEANTTPNAHQEHMVTVALVSELRSNLEILVSETTALKERLIALIAQRHAEKQAKDMAPSQYDAAGLDRLIASDPERYGWLRDFRSDGSEKSA